MIYKITHQVRYHYNRKVFLEPHRVLLRPRQDGTQQLQKYTLDIHPAPFVHSFVWDPYGNAGDQLWFKEKTDRFEVTARSIIQTVRDNPFDYLIVPKALKLPIRYPAPLRGSLSPYFPSAKPPASVSKFAAAIAKASRHDTLDFLRLLCVTLHQKIRTEPRPEGAPWKPSTTLKKKKAACRDLAVLFMECARVYGMASRFVSGYYEDDPRQSQKDLHAWTEVYLEGAGWQGFDPSSGLAVADRHIPLASSPSAKETMPVHGTFRGTGAQGMMTYDVKLTREQKA